MANSVKGHIPLKLSDGREFVLVADFDATIEAEGLYGKPAAKIAADASEGYMGAIRALFYGMLKRHQPQITTQDVSDLLSGHMPEIEAAMNAASEAAAPDATGDGDRPNPPRRRPGKTSGTSGAKRA